MTPQPSSSAPSSGPVVPIQIRRITAPKCSRCTRPLLYASSQRTGLCCDCRHDHSDHTYGCVVCNKPLIRGGVWTCDACQLVTASTGQSGDQTREGAQA